MKEPLRRFPTLKPILRHSVAVAAGLAVLGLAASSTATLAKQDEAKKSKASELFQMTKVWSVHLKFTPDQWEAMEPKGGEGGMFGGGRGGFGGRGGRGGGFGPGMFLAPAIMDQADKDKNGKLTPAEFNTLGEKWFADWDKSKAGKLNNDQIREGLNTSIGQPNFGGGGRGQGGRSFLLGQEGKRNGLASAAGVEFNYVHADLEFDGKVLKDVAVRYKGNGTFMQSRGSLKRSLKIQIDEHVKGQELHGVSTLNLHNSVTDASWMNEVLSHKLYRDAGVAAPRSAYARVHVTVPGKHDKEYFGLYSVIENPGGDFLAENFGTKKGALLKPVTPRPFEDLGDDWSKYNQVYDPKNPLTPEQKQRVIDFCKLVSHASDDDFAAKVGDYLDFDQVARYLAVTAWLSTLDSILTLGQNYYAYLDPKAQKLQLLPWDLDHSFGQFGMRADQESREQLSVEKPWQGEIRFFDRLFKVEAFKKTYRAKMEEFSKTIFRPERFVQQVDEIAAAIRPAVKEESEDKLARFDKVVAGEPAAPPFGGFGGGRGPGGGEGPRGGGGGGGGGGPFGFQPPKPIKSFAKARAESVEAQLAGKSEGRKLDGFGGGRGGGRGGRGGFGGPGNFMSGAFVSAFDSDKNSEVSKAEFLAGFEKWFASWNSDKSGALTDDQLRAGINQDLAPPPPPGGFGGPGGPGRNEGLGPRPQ